jgi:hypothetical protein
VHRRRIPHRLLCLLISLLFITQVVAAQDYDNEDSERDFATLSVRLDSKGSTVAFLGWNSSQRFSPAVEQKLSESLGVRLEKFSPEGVEEDEG